MTTVIFLEGVTSLMKTSAMDYFFKRYQFPFVDELVGNSTKWSRIIQTSSGEIGFGIIRLLSLFREVKNVKEPFLFSDRTPFVSTIFDGVWKRMRNEPFNRSVFKETLIEILLEMKKSFPYNFHIFIVTGESHLADASIRRRGNWDAEFGIDYIDYQNLYFNDLSIACKEVGISHTDIFLKNPYDNMTLENNLVEILNSQFEFLINEITKKLFQLSVREKPIENDAWLIQLENETARIPKLGTKNSAGFDVFANEEVDIEPGDTYKISLGFSMALPPDKYVMLEIRSSWASRLNLLCRVIDPDYRGLVYAYVMNVTSDMLTIYVGDRFAQAIVYPAIRPEISAVPNLPESQRIGGFGSTGQK